MAIPNPAPQLGARLSRALFLAANTKIEVPNFIARNVSEGQLIQEVARQGIMGAATELNLDARQLNSLYQKGEKLGPINGQEFRTIMTELALSSLEDDRGGLSTSDYTKIMEDINGFLRGKGISMIKREEVDLSKADMGFEMPKWECGFIPFDLLLEGLYQAVVTIIGKTGMGKTKIMLALMVAMRAKGVIDEAWFYETEIPMPLMLHQLSAARVSGVVDFKNGDRMITGLLSADEILAEIKANPNPRRAIFIDSPDVMAGNEGEGKRFALETIYRTLVEIKGESQIVVAASQGKRNDGAIITSESVAESYAKSQYSDVLIGVKKGAPMGEAGFNACSLNVAKNRFGMSDLAITFPFNYKTLAYDVSEKVINAFEDDQDW